MRGLKQYISFSCFLPVVIGVPLPSSSATIPPTPSKFVFAHVIVGNTFNFTSDAWSSNIFLAHTAGIDAFALNIGKQAWEVDQVKSAYDAAQNSGTGFKAFLSLDMSSLPCTSVSDAQHLVSLIRSQSSHPAQLLYGFDNKSVVSTFAGESCTFSAASPSEGWAQHFLAPLASEIYFVPAFFVDPAQLSKGNNQGKGGFGGVIDGDFNWNSGWPTQLTTAALVQSASNPSALSSLLDLNVSSPTLSLIPIADGLSSPPARGFSLSSSSHASAQFASSFTDSAGIPDLVRAAFAGVAGAFTADEKHLVAIQDRRSSPARSSGAANAAGVANAGIVNSVKKTYMAAVSPWFFTHFSPQTFNKNFIFLSDNHLYSKRWETLIAMRDAVDFVEIVSWNDFGESHYIGPIEGTQPNSQAWVNGNNHTGWLHLTAYYSKAFKSGAYPAVAKDKVVMWARTHPRDASASEDTVGAPSNFQLTEDFLWATVLVPAPSTVTLSTSPNSVASDTATLSSANTFEVPAGISHLKAPLTPGGGMHAIVSRGGEVTLNFTPEGYTFDPNPTKFNFNAFVAASP